MAPQTSKSLPPRKPLRALLPGAPPSTVTSPRNIIAAAFILTLLCLATLLSCSSGSDTTLPDEIKLDLDAIKSRGTLRAITTYSSTSYFIYRGQPLGFEYELLRRLAEHLGVRLEIVVANNLDNLFAMLLAGEGDLVAHSLTITKSRKNIVNFTLPIATTHQVLIQRKPENWRDMKQHEIERALIRNPVNLIGKTINVRKNSAYYERLINLSEEIGGDIDIVPVEGRHSTEQLIAMVADGDIDYTVADENLAFIQKTHHSILDIKTTLSLPQRIAWAVRKSSPNLLSQINLWLAEIKESPDYYTIYNKYFRNRRQSRVWAAADVIAGERVSEYDSLLKLHAAELGWDWRLLAALVFQESAFDPDAESWAGAQGLMQMMPAIGQKFGAVNLFDPAQSIAAGAAYLAYLQEIFADVPDTLQRTHFVLAAYNAGENHVNDARRLAEKYGEDPNVWTDNVEAYMLKKSDPKFYNDDSVYYGPARGEETVNYVRTVFDIYDHYQALIAFEE